MRESSKFLSSPRARRSDNDGFTLVEASIALAIFATLLASAFSLAFDMSSFVRDYDDDVAVQTEGNRIVERFMDVLRESGRVTIGGVTYPRVVAGGAELEFRVLQDLDGNGYAFDDATGALEWSPKIFRMKTDAAGNLGIYDGASVVYALGRFVTGLEFRTIAEDATLHLREVRIRCESRKPTGKGYDAVQAVDASVHLRN